MLKQKLLSIASTFIHPCPAPPCANYLHLPYGCPGNTTQAKVTTSEHWGKSWSFEIEIELIFTRKGERNWPFWEVMIFCDSGGPDWLPPKKRIVSHEGPELTSFGPKSVTCLTGGPELTSKTFRLWHGKYWCLFLSSNAIILLPLYLWTSAANQENLENFLLRTAAVEGARFVCRLDI